MEHVSITFLSISLVILLFISAFFSAAEIGMMAINRYRLNHLVRQKHRLAIIVNKLLKQPDRLLGVILIGNNFANITASAVTTLIAGKLFGEIGIAIATLILTFVVLIVEVAPKTLAASYQEPIAFFSVFPLMILLKVLYPIVWLVNGISNGLLKLFRVKLRHHRVEHLSGEELRTVVYEAGSLIPREHRNMLLSIFDLEEVTVNDIMIPRNEIVGINLEDDWDKIKQQLQTSQYTRLPLYRDDINNAVGMLHLRAALSLISDAESSSEDLLQVSEPLYFVPEHTPLNTQLLNFREIKSRIGLVVNEYGDIEGLVTLEDILEEIVGEFTTNVPTSNKLIHAQSDGSYLVDGSVTIRELNRDMHWDLPTDGPKTLNGLIMEYLESIPQPMTSVRIAGYPIEIIKVKDNAVKTVIIFPKLRVVVIDEHH